MLGVLRVFSIALSRFIGAHGTDVSVGVSSLSGENLVRGEKPHWSQVGFEPRSLQIEWTLLQAL